MTHTVCAKQKLVARVRRLCGHDHAEQRTGAVIWLCGEMMALELIGHCRLPEHDRRRLRQFSSLPDITVKVDPS